MGSPESSQQPSADAPADGSFAGKHPDRAALPILVGPATDDQKNAVRPDLVVVACWRLNDIRFHFDSCFVLPDANPDFRSLAALLKDHPKSVLSIFGHADPVGNESYNKMLSGRRGMAVYSILIRDVAKWESLYSEDHWGSSQILSMLDSLGYSAADNDGLHNGAPSDALKAFQTDNKPLTAHGYNNAATRKKLFKAYMDRLCGPGLELKKDEDFLARAADPDRRGDVQGCSEFNPLMILSKDQLDFLQKPANHAARDEANAQNRRVLVLLFRAGSKVAPGDWPCPKAETTVISGCEKRFFYQGRDRLKNTDSQRFFDKGQKTFACRFYERFSVFSPCENPGDMWVLRVLSAGKGSIPGRKPLANQPYILAGVSAGGAPIRGHRQKRCPSRRRLGQRTFNDIDDRRYYAYPEGRSLAANSRRRRGERSSL